MNAATKLKIRLNLSDTELQELHDFFLANSNILNDAMRAVFGKVRLAMFKLDMDMPVDGYKVLAKKPAKKNSMEGLGFGMQETANHVVRDPDLPDMSDAPAFDDPAYMDWLAAKVNAGKIATATGENNGNKQD